MCMWLTFMAGRADGRSVSAGLCRNPLGTPALFSNPERSTWERPLGHSGLHHPSLQSMLKFGEQAWAGYGRSYHLDAFIGRAGFC